MTLSLSKPFESTAFCLLAAVAAAAPWLAGAQPALNQYGWWFVWGLSGAFALALLSCIATAQPLRVPKTVLWPVLLLLACVGWWTTRPEPRFTTGFAPEQWSALRTLLPGGFINMPRDLRLGLAAAVLLGILAATHVCVDRRFRDLLMLVIGWSGVAVAAYAVAERYLDWQPPSWVRISGGQERFNAAFFHYSSIAACVNLAWPLLVFRAKPGGEGAGKIFYWSGSGAAIGLAALGLPLWPAQGAQAVAVALAVAGIGWILLAKRWYASRKTLAWIVTGGFAALLLTQGWLIRQTHENYPDGWFSAANSQIESPDTDSRLRALSAKRSDRMISSNAPNRQAAWLAATRMTMDNPVVGGGPGFWVKRLPLYTNDHALNSFYFPMQFTHHDLLQTAAEWGIAPLLCWLALWLGALWHSLTGSANAKAVFLALLGIALHSLVDFPLQIPALQIWAALLLGMALAPREIIRRHPHHATKRTRPRPTWVSSSERV